MSVRREGRGVWSLSIGGESNRPLTRFTFWRSIFIMALVDVAVLALTIEMLYREAQAGGISILVLLSSVLLLVMMAIGQYRWRRNARRGLFEHRAEDDIPSRIGVGSRSTTRKKSAPGEPGRNFWSMLLARRRRPDSNR